MDLAGWLPSLLCFSRERPVSDGVLQGSQLKAGLHQDWQLVAIGPCGESCRMSEIMGRAWHGCERVKLKIIQSHLMYPDP